MAMRVPNYRTEPKKVSRELRKWKGHLKVGRRIKVAFGRISFVHLYLSYVRYRMTGVK